YGKFGVSAVSVIGGDTREVSGIVESGTVFERYFKMSWPDEAQEIQSPSTSTTEEELFVFGYSCKVFRDDEKAEWVDDGKHLIPWMGDADSGLFIDRYDVRGALMDLKPYEAPPGGTNYLEGLTREELAVEKLCDEERYRDFDEDTEYEENAYQDQEAIDRDLGIQVESTRPLKEFGSVGYVYNDSPASIGPEPKKLEDELPYTRPAELMIPPDILLPATMKSHAIIEKTAKFISSQGTQMEIILKTKQSKNPLFDFLSHNDPLNPYYKFLVDAIKNNLYKPPDEIPYPDDSPNGKGTDGNSSDDDEDGYLHPSLMKTPSDITRFIIPSGSFKPSINCAYSMLVSKIKEFSAEQNSVNNNAVVETDATPPCPPPAPPVYNYTDYPTQVHSMPSPQEQLIIDKMANYVVKNGPDFEVMARTKGDPRFAFLDSYHEHNWYYVSCKERCMIEAQAVVASKGFVRYKEDDNGTSQKIFPAETAAPSEKVKSSVFQPSTLNKVNTDESRKIGSVGVGTRVKIKDPSPAKLKPEKEKLIKLPLSLPNFASVLKQASLEDDGENIAGKDKSEGSGLTQMLKKEDNIQKLKEERRKKAALFLQRLKKLEPVQSQSSVAPSSEVVSDVESIPSPSSMTRVSERLEETPKTPQNVDITEDVRTRSDSKQQVTDILMERIKSSSDSMKTKDNDKIKDRHRSDEDHRSQNRRRSRSHHRRSRSSSLSDSNPSSSSSYSPKRKKSKRKHSKKRHKKRDRSRIRGPTWTDEEVHKLFHVWSIPTIFNGFLNEKRKREVFSQVSTELRKLNVNRSWEECRAKIKNLKGEYKKSRDANSPQTFKYYSLMEKILNTVPGHEKSVSVVTSVPCSSQTLETGQSVQIEFEIMPTSEIDFQRMKSELPIEISPGGSINSIIIPRSNFITSDLESIHVQDIHQEESGQLLVITTSEAPMSGTEQAATSKSSHPGHHDSDSEVGPTKRYPYRESYTNAGKRHQKVNTGDVNYKRRKLHQLSEKMAETVDRVLTRTTNALIQEMKASEERFMEWEEKKRAEEQQREEKLLKSFVDAMRNKSAPTEAERLATAEEKESQERQRILSMIQSSEDPCAVTFDLLATRLTTVLTDQQRETEQNLLQWEAKMQKQEMKHTENLFNMILTAVKSHKGEDDDCM
ncbi:unnamed protein product, partial [Allacma fusca]